MSGYGNCITPIKIPEDILKAILKEFPRLHMESMDKLKEDFENIKRDCDVTP